MNDETLIMLVEQCPHLYDQSLKSFKDQQMRENSWVSIAEHMLCDVNTVKKRWDNLRDRFVRTYRNHMTKPPSGSQGGIKTTVEFIYFKQMMWLGPFLRKRKLTSSAEKQDKEEDIASISEENIYDSTHASETYDVEDDGTLSLTSPTTSYDERPETSLSGGTPTFRTEKKRCTVQDTMAKAISTFSAMCETRTQNHSESDINFMKAIAEDVQVLNPAKKLLFKREVLDLLIKFTNDQS